MHPLLKRMVVRGSFVALATVAVALLCRRALLVFISSDPNISITPGDGFNLQGPIVFGVFGFCLLAVMEWASFVQERAKAAKTGIVKEGQTRLEHPSPLKTPEKSA